MTLGAISRKENDFDYIASNELKSLLFGKSVLGQPSSGNIKSVTNIKLQDIKTFIKSHLVSSRVIVVLGGDIDIQTAKKSIAKVIQTLPKGKKEDVTHYETLKKPTQSILRRDTQQAYIYFGSPYNLRADDVDIYKAKVATFILGTGGFGSRLMEEIRVKKGLAYSAYARVHITKSSNYFSGYLQTKLESQEKAQKTVNQVIANFVKNGVTQEELEQTKKFLLGSEPLRVETMSQRLNRTFMEFYNGKKLGSSSKELKKIEKLTLKDLNKFIKKHNEINNLSYAIVTN
jgi:predicted Zn-dependent peptidase